MVERWGLAGGSDGWWREMRTKTLDVFSSWTGPEWVCVWVCMSVSECEWATRRRRGLARIIILILCIYIIRPCSTFSIIFFSPSLSSLTIPPYLLLSLPSGSFRGSSGAAFFFFGSYFPCKMYKKTQEREYFNGEMESRRKEEEYQLLFLDDELCLSLYRRCFWNEAHLPRSI